MARIANLNNTQTPLVNLSGSIAAGGTAQLVCPQMPTRAYLLFQNTSDTVMYVGIGGATATVAVSSGALTTFTVTNAGSPLLVVVAATNLVTPLWTPVSTNTLTGGSSYFSDREWTNHSARFYRLSSP